MVKEFDWINAYDWEKLDAKKFALEKNLVSCEEVFEGSLKSVQSKLPKTLSFYTFLSGMSLMYVLSFPMGYLITVVGERERLDNFVKLAPNFGRIRRDGMTNPYVVGNKLMTPSLAEAFQRIPMRKGTVTSLNYPRVTWRKD